MVDVESARASISLPRPNRVVLENFSLYSNAPTIEADLGSGVFCLAGANGLGKSTFLAALNFGLTGIVPSPTRKFESMREYYRFSTGYSADFFRGRIASGDHELAQVSVDMTIGSTSFSFTRGMFEPLALRALKVEDEFGSRSYEDESEELLQSRYAEEILVATGLESFAQFAFLQIHVLTFDERRHLLFWDEDISQNALFTAFGIGEIVERSDALRRAIEKTDSLARNLQWQATDTRKRLRELEAERPDETGSEAEDDAQALSTELDEAREDLQRVQASLRDARLSISDVGAAMTATRRAYDSAFEAQFSGRRSSSTHPIVEDAVSNGVCGICGARGPAVAEAVQRAIESHRCPLCETPDDDVEDALDTVHLEQLSTQLEELESALSVAEADYQRLDEQYDERRGLVSLLNARLLELEEDTDLALSRDDASLARGVDTLARRYKQQIADLLERKKQERSKRDAAKRELKTLQDELAFAYSDAQATFVPEFMNLARAFLGLELDIELVRSGGTLQLELTVESTKRRAHEALSESQRFFVDIALRMALARQMVGRATPTCLLIDTPEGSLDIAYESRAGTMFADFVQAGDQLLLTANINTSQLLYQLARQCGRRHMTLRRMTDWTTLSDVQAAEEELFDEAFEAIEAALAEGPAE